MSFTWQKTPRQAWNVRAYQVVVQRAVFNLLEMWSAKIEAEMKQDALWKDRTGNARQSLASFAFTMPDGTPVLVAKQQMEYGLWLEIGNGGRYAIVMPTLEFYYGQVMDSVRELLR